jgi:dTDP-4-dehydrorhamnose reductase
MAQPDMLKTVLILGSSGMLGNAMLRLFAASPGYDVRGTVRTRTSGNKLPADVHSRLISDVDVENADTLAKVFAEVRPDVVINCVGLVKQLAAGKDPLAALPINSMLPHRLAKLCDPGRCRLVHISTDCVFSGAKGMYKEEDLADARDLYGLSKYLGEVDYPNAVTLRTSIVGHELGTAHGLVGWFLAQKGGVKGFTRAIFSGLPTVELARVVRDYVLPRPELHGLYHVSAEPISKYDLLRLVSQIYGRDVQITPDEQLVIDRSLDSSRFRRLTGYTPAAWPELVRLMREFG